MNLDSKTGVTIAQVFAGLVVLAGVIGLGYLAYRIGVLTLIVGEQN